MKLIIDIPEEALKEMKTEEFISIESIDTAIECIKNGTPLDDVKAEIEQLDRYYDNDYFSTNNCPMYKCNEVLLIIDKYRAESEDKE